MIFSPWPVILRSFPMTDFSPVDGALITLLVLPGDVVRGSGILGPADGLRVNMEAPEVISEACTNSIRWLGAPPQRFYQLVFFGPSGFVGGHIPISGSVAVMARDIYRGPARRFPVLQTPRRLDAHPYALVQSASAS